MKNVMKRAWEIRREAAAKWDCEASEIIFSLCLKMAWAETKKEGSMTHEEKIEKARNEKLTVYIDNENRLYSKYYEKIVREIHYYCSNSTWNKEEKHWDLVDTSKWIRKNGLIENLEKAGFNFI